MSFRTFKAPDNEICGSHLGVPAIKFKGKERPLLIIFYSADVYLVATITRNCKNLIYVSETTVDLWWSRQYGRHWLHVCVADALSSPNFQISEGDLGHLQHFKCHLQNLARTFVVVANSQVTPL